MHNELLEPNNTPTNAAPIELQKTITNQLSGINDYKDYYSLNVIEGNEYTVTLNNLGSASSEISLYAYNGKNTLVIEGESKYMQVTPLTEESHQLIPMISGELIIYITGGNQSLYYSYEIVISQ